MDFVQSDLDRDCELAERTLDFHNEAAGLEVNNERKVDAWHLIVSLRALAHHHGFDLRETFDDAMLFDPNGTLADGPA